MTNLGPYRAVLFDLDGTLLNTLDDLADSVNHVLDNQGYPVHPVDAYKLFVGNGARTLIQRALPSGARTPEKITQALEEFEAVYAERFDMKTRPYPGIADMLDILFRRKELKRAILSNKPHESTTSAVSAMLGKWDFDVVFGARPGRPVKPDPQVALEIANILEVDPSEVLYVGDSSVDMQTARAAGMFPLGVAWGFRTVLELQENGAAAIVHSPVEILAYLDSSGTGNGR